MTPHEFITKWQRSQLSERSACQQHFCDLCDLLGQPKPAAADPDGAWYTFERGVHKTDGGNGWADVWMQGHFGWEYKGKHKDLKAAYRQLQLYREDLENPPLLVVCDMDRFEIHTNFTGTAKKLFAFDLDGLADPQNLDVLRKLFAEPQSLRPGQTNEALTRQAAELFGQLADGMRTRGVHADEAAHFLMKLMFCMFAEDIGLLQNKVFSKIVAGAKKDPDRMTRFLGDLFQAMSAGGYFGADEILYFNGGLFNDCRVVDLRPKEIETLNVVNAFDWSEVEPSIFGTLFERTLDPAKRSQIGAHYTSRDDIETLLEPVMLVPLRREWDAVKARCEALLPKIRAEAKKDVRRRKETKPRREFNKRIRDFLERLAHVSVLDPACGSGNFLYVAIHLLLDLEKEVIAFAATHGLPQFPQVRPTQLAGIEINPYAQELAQVVIWIGYLQWMHHNGFAPPRDPVLEPIESIRRMDAIIDLSDPEHPIEPEWPEAEFIVGNPPFLGGSRMWEELGREYQQGLWGLYDGRVPGAADLCCYWFEKALDQVLRTGSRRVGLLATQGVRGGANRKVLERIKSRGDIFFAESDRDWILDGAFVHVSMVGFDDGSEETRSLDGQAVGVIHANLTAASDVTRARRLAANMGLCFIGPKKAGKFEIPIALADQWLKLPNPHGRPNSDVLIPWVNGTTLVNGRPSHWIIDTGCEMAEREFAQYEIPYQYVLENVKPDRDRNKEKRTRENWWRFKRPAHEMRDAVRALPRFFATVRHAKHRIFQWVDSNVICDDGIYLFATADIYTFGTLHSRIHSVWALSQGTQVRERESGFRYTPTTCFETFPFPEPTDEQRAAIAAAARELDTLRNNWLNPPEWTRQEALEFPGSVDGPWRRYIVDESSPAAGVGTVRYPRLVPRDEESAAQLKRRTLTNLYNQNPTWLQNAHRTLDEAVFTAYGWDAGISDDELLVKLLESNLSREST